MAQQRQDRRGEVQAATASATGLACFIFRFLRCPLIEHFQALAPGQRKSQRRRRCHFWGEAVRGRGAQPLGGWEARVSGPGGFEKGGHPHKR